MLGQQANGCVMARSNSELQDLQPLNAPERQAAPQHPVVRVFDPYPRVFLYDIELCHQFLQIGELHIPGELL